jgi:alkylated DNA repair dioxygenase AlkB
MLKIDLGPYATIASLSLGTPRNFRLRETDTVDPAYKVSSAGIRTYEVNLGHNSLVLMNGGCQERYKHT